MISKESMVDQCREQVAKEEPQQRMERRWKLVRVKIEQTNSRPKLHESFRQEKKGGEK